MNKHFKIIVPFYNVEDWIKRTIYSVKLQDYKDFQCVLVNDVSTDNTAAIIQDDRFLLIQNKEKNYARKNIQLAIEASQPSKEDIIVILDGDDWLAHGRVLSSLRKEYKENDCWMTYGSYVEFPSMIRGKFSQQVPAEVIRDNSFRKVPWMTSHLRTFKFGLWQNLKNEHMMKDVNKEIYFDCTWDLAIYYPLLEMAGCRSHYINEVLYIYNRQNPLNVDKIKHNLQLSEERQIRDMPPLKPLREL